MRPPNDLKRWSKNDLVREVQRLRAILREHADRPGDDARVQSVKDPMVGGSPHEEGTTLLDARSAVLVDHTAVVLVDTKADQPVAMMLTIAGRINYSDDRVEHAYLYGADGAAALVTEHVGLAGRAAGMAGRHGERFAVEFQQLCEERMGRMP